MTKRERIEIQKHEQLLAYAAQLDGAAIEVYRGIAARTLSAMARAASPRSQAVIMAAAEKMGVSSHRDFISP